VLLQSPNVVFQHPNLCHGYGKCSNPYCLKVAASRDYFHCHKLKDDSEDKYNNRQRSCANKPFNPLNAELNPICHLLALLGAHRIIHVSRIRVKGRVKYHLLALLGAHHILHFSRIRVNRMKTTAVHWYSSHKKKMLVSTE
jgi:hypothetical protein